jgi:hypothetical protein
MHTVEFSLQSVPVVAHQSGNLLRRHLRRHGETQYLADLAFELRQFSHRISLLSTIATSY